MRARDFHPHDTKVGEPLPGSAQLDVETQYAERVARIPSTPEMSELGFQLIKPILDDVLSLLHSQLSEALYSTLE
ncbi:MAG: hypothetical protein ACU85U_17485 [Gammaproteobacteria bacterium]|jgi:hypothetical protein